MHLRSCARVALSPPADGDDLFCQSAAYPFLYECAGDIAWRFPVGISVRQILQIGVHLGLKARLNLRVCGHNSRGYRGAIWMPIGSKNCLRGERNGGTQHIGGRHRADHKWVLEIWKSCATLQRPQRRIGIGGALGGTRTHDLRITNPALSSLVRGPAELLGRHQPIRPKSYPQAIRCMPHSKSIQDRGIPLRAGSEFLGWVSLLHNTG